jgi:hypothetical protein
MKRALLLLVLAACGSSHTDPGLFSSSSGSSGGAGSVGAPCKTNADCASQCATSGDFQSMCTAPCKGDQDCPSGASCVTTSGGTCAVACNSSADCASLGPGLVCRSKDREGANGETLVCRKD